jgi:hypothetical protein
MRCMKWSCLVGAIAASVQTTSCEPLSIDITSPEDGAEISGGRLLVRYEIRGAEGEVNYACQLDDEAAQPCLFMAPPEDPSGPLSVIGFEEPLPQGPHTLLLSVTDASGRSARDAVSFTVTEGLRVTISSPLPNERLTTTSVAVTFSVSGATSALETSCKIDSGFFAPCTSPHVFAGLARGMHVISVDARSGLDYASALVSFGIQ